MQALLSVYKKLIFTFLTWLIGSILAVQSMPLSPQAQVSLITVSPGEELYSMYGHSAIRINDPAVGMDIIFNYGVFDFRTPNFYVKFVRGKLPYQLGPGYYQDLLQSSQRDNRSVYEQVLNLTLSEKQQVADFLENNYKPENREYLYDFFYDNCATRIRDVFKKTLKTKLAFNQKPEADPKSFRELVGIYQAPHPWVDLGVDLVMGLPSDKITSPYQDMILPDFLMKRFAQARMQTPTGTQSFVTTSTQVFKAPSAPTTTTFLTPTLFFWLLFLVVAFLTFRKARRGKVAHILDIFLFGLTGLLGIILVFLWFGTDHKSFAGNLNLLWALPFHIPMAFLLLKKQKTPFLKRYFMANCGLLIILIVTWLFLPQAFHPSVFPIVLTLALRSWYIYNFERRSKRATNPYR